MRRNNQSQATHIQPLTPNQEVFLRTFRNNRLVVAVGAAGTGKTYLAVNSAVNELLKDSKTSLILSRTSVPVHRTLGYMPGDIKDKLTPWLAPMLTEIKKRVGSNTLDSWLRSGRVELLPLETIRGRSFDRSVVLIDEAQNLTVEEVKSIVTRVGEETRLVLMGDLSQRDTKASGLLWLLELIKNHPTVKIPLVLFEVEDIVRSDLVGDIVRAYSQDSEDVYREYRYYAEK